MWILLVDFDIGCEFMGRSTSVESSMICSVEDG